MTRARLRTEVKPRRVRPTRRRRRPPPRLGWRAWAAIGAEALCLLGAALVGVIVALGFFADWFVGAGVWRHLVPFAAAVLGLGVATGALLWIWMRARRCVVAHVPWLPAAAAAALSGLALWVAAQPPFEHALRALQQLVGGQAAAERAAIAHQVFAAYRRAPLSHLAAMFDRARPYQAGIGEAATTFAVDPDLLMGVAATESSLLPRRSRDGGQGLFQITAAPAAALEAARDALGVERIDLSDDRQNAFVGAATLRGYLDEMRGDLFLGLLAYNIGPRNGGLRAIMQQYGARDFVTIQPYLQQLPRDYPIRVLSAALAHRVWRREGGLPKYEDGDNAQRIQQMGIPGLE